MFCWEIEIGNSIMAKIRYYFTIKNSHDEHIDVKFQSSHDVPINCYMTIASAELTL